ncbi:hypothetical protein [Methanoregula sp.]|uniref:hypothetical protein n=1 Tax=Methanoregula sp. TaxID=2052170 RepID=UPI0035627A5F
MQIHRLKTGRIVLITLLLAALFVAAVSAADEKGVVRSDASKEQLNLINELYGKNITVLDYMEQVHPEHLVGVPDSVKKNMAQQKMNWWGKEPALNQITTESTSRTERATVSVTAIGYKFDSRTIRFGGTTTASGLETQPWYIYNEAFLINHDTGQTVDSTSASSQDGVWSIPSSKDTLYPANGNYYVHSWGYIPSPYYAEDSDDTSVFSFP